MSQLRNLVPYVERHLVAVNTTWQYEWFTTWMPAEGVDEIRAVLKAKNEVGSLDWQLVVQYASVRADEPGGPNALGNPQSGNGEYATGAMGVTNDTDVNRIFRLGVMYRSGQAQVSQADVALTASWRSLGTDLGRVRRTLAVTNQGPKYEPLTDWVPVSFASKVRAAFVLTSVTGSNNDFRYQLAFQTADTSIQQPNAWVNAEPNGWSQPGGPNEERNTGDIPINVSDEMWIRLGVAYELQSGSQDNTTAVLDAACACQ